MQPCYREVTEMQLRCTRKTICCLPRPANYLSLLASAYTCSTTCWHVQNSWQTLCRYADAIASLPPGDPTHKLHCNQSLALSKSHRLDEALFSAEAAIAAAPAWAKAHWRRGTALRGLQRFPEAMHAFLEAWRLMNGDT